MKADVYTESGNKSKTQITLNKDIFGILTSNHDLIKHAYVAHQTNKRTNIAKTKTRGMVSGGGKKPWSQKGTGQARFGSSRNPIWRSGGIAFGPTGNENYSHNITPGLKRRALIHALSMAATDKKVMVIETFKGGDGRVATTDKLLKNLKITGFCLMIVSEHDELVRRATKNLANTKVTRADYLNVCDVIDADSIVVTKNSLDILDKWLLKDKKVKEA